ncbi:serine/threonine-protein kinase RsbT [Caldalkalibacillus uzonensis]|uniref:Serine/threonine-protein kinase RsbT n=1 Tax=Caldalkalibacillus uzonensis TaxID=353224 RepID=A0ABU0CVM6_9BACI|nr:ATP-binding protein [Caldalkalibacillus uzonensis]MDQ0340480.1 serine/threonine-protein kinase RsbT [Caldalkalibacillus uzonensis]
MSLHKVYIKNEDDVLQAVTLTRQLVKLLSFSKVDEQKILVSVSELTRNILDHASGKGVFKCELTQDQIRITVIDDGPGIDNVQAALRGKKRAGSQGLGLGLSGVQRLMDEMSIETSTGGGTKIIAIKRKS